MTTTADLSQFIMAHKEETIGLRRELHRIPELAFEEFETAKLVAARLRGWGYKVVEGIGGTGVLGLLDGARPGKTLMLRADLDGVAMDDPGNVEYSSRLAGRNHCCGHDANMTIMLACAEAMSQHRDQFSGRLAFVFQPADEPMKGAAAMIADGLFDHFKPDFVIGQHIIPLYEAGQVVVQAGPVWASGDDLTIKIGASPSGSEVGSATVAVANTVSAIARLQPPAGSTPHPVAINVRSLKAQQGRTGGSGEIELNLGTHDSKLRHRLLSEIASAVTTAAAGRACEIEATHQIPPLNNDATVVAAVRNATVEVLGESAVVTGYLSFIADDFALYLERAPGALILVGTNNASKNITAMWHTPGFDVDEEALLTGAQIITLSAIELLNNG